MKKVKLPRKRKKAFLKTHDKYDYDMYASFASTGYNKFPQYATQNRITTLKFNW